MLPSQLMAIKQHLSQIQEAGKTLATEQQELYEELLFLENNALVQAEIEKWSGDAMFLESLTVASDNCASCGKKY